MEKEQKKTLYKMGLPIILGTILLIGVSYAWLTLTLNGTKTNVLKAGTLSLTLTDDATEGINLENTVPMLDEVGVTTSPYSFTLTNNGDIDSGYTIYLDDVVLEEGETRLTDTVIKYNLVKDSTSMATALLSTTGTNPNRVLDSGTIKPGETYSYDLRLWIDQDATTTISGQVFKGKIRVEAIQTGPKEVTPASCFTFDESTGAITLYKCGTKVKNGSDVVDATADLLPDGIDSPITDVVIPKTINGVAVTTIGNEAFGYEGYGMGITSVVISDSITTIGDGAFQNNSLTNVVIPNSVTTIGTWAFHQNRLTSVTISNSVTTIGQSAFEYNKLTSIVIPDSVSTIGACAFQRNQLTSVTIGNGLETISQNAFSHNQLTNVTIGNSVTTIGMDAFYSNKLTNVVIPNSVSEIIYNAFGDNKLTSVIIQGKSSVADFAVYGNYDNVSPFGWASGYSDSNITWNG